MLCASATRLAELGIIMTVLGWLLIIVGLAAIIAQIVLLLRARAKTEDVKNAEVFTAELDAKVIEIIKALATSVPLGLIGLILVLAGLQTLGVLDLVALFGANDGSGGGPTPSS